MFDLGQHLSFYLKITFLFFTMICVIMGKSKGNHYYKKVLLLSLLFGCISVLPFEIALHG